MEQQDDTSFDSIGKMPIYLKGVEIDDLIHKICELIPADNDHLQRYKQYMLEDACMLSVKVAGAAGGDLYDIRMENAAIVRKAARDLLTHCRRLETYGFRETHYLELIREDIEQYRLLFIDWMEGFDKWDYMIDRWGLFNPPGVDSHNTDPGDHSSWDGNSDR